MNISAEKEYLYKMMKEITEERRLLTNMYYDLKKRLDFLNSLEQRGIEELSLEGYIDLHRRINKELPISNIKREAEHLIKKIKKDNIIEESEKTIIPAEEIEREKFNHRRRRGKTSMEKILNSTVNILKEEGMPIKLNELHKKVEESLEESLSIKSFQNHTLKKAMEKYPITRPHRGYYQYKF